MVSVLDQVVYSMFIFIVKLEVEIHVETKLRKLLYRVRP